MRASEFSNVLHIICLKATREEPRQETVSQSQKGVGCPSGAAIHHFHRINVVIFLLLLLVGSPFGETDCASRLHIAPSDLMWQSPAAAASSFLPTLQECCWRFLFVSLLLFLLDRVATNRVQPQPIQQLGSNLKNSHLLQA